MWELIQNSIRKNKYLKIYSVTESVGTTTNQDFTVNLSIRKTRNLES
ncbi:hypothetical protein LEP1GSC021_4587 [Leptospira noguchii str. 1993005606]|nr:hypothetical protein LEP1GSC021_4587 [Leptospira noguchii str. 1993005606]